MRRPNQGQSAGPWWAPMPAGGVKGKGEDTDTG
jgi:hypothetical protein